MPSNAFRFDKSWELPNASVEEVYDVLAHGELLPLWWKRVYVEAQKAQRQQGTGGGRAPARSRPRISLL